jgi:L-alanine-DL-glutamate epimerase-like enolase superfamily enzyme
MDAANVVGVWNRIYRGQLASHGMGAAAAMAMSGIDMALWDIRGQAVGWPLYRLLGGEARAVPAYAGGVALGWQPPAALAAEARAMVARGFKAVKLRLGDGWRNDSARVAAVRDALGEEIDILTDANTGYSLEDARRVIPALDAAKVGWLEEPFSPLAPGRYEAARAYGAVPFAAGENHYTRFEFASLIDEKAVTILQPDLSKAGGITETLRIAAMAAAKSLVVHPHSSMTGINAAATVHFLCAIDNGGYYEADVSTVNRFRDDLVSNPCPVGADGTVRPPEGAGLGIDVDEAFLHHHPPIAGPAYVAA